MLQNALSLIITKAKVFGEKILNSSVSLLASMKIKQFKDMAISIIQKGFKLNIIPIVCEISWTIIVLKYEPFNGRVVYLQVNVCNKPVLFLVQQKYILFYLNERN